MKAVAFWVFTSGELAWRKIVVLPSHTESDPLIAEDLSKPHEEGYSSYREMYWLEEDGVHCCCQSSGKDCDGYHAEDAEYVAAFDELEAIDIDPEANPEEAHLGIKTPRWETVNGSRLDSAAEAANY
jgi:hypothetical protein